MIHKLPTGMFRVRYAYGHERYYKKLKSLKDPTPRVLAEIERMERQYGFPAPLKTRRSCNCIHEWQAKEIEALFKEANRLESLGKPVPKNFLNFEIAPERHDYLEDLGYAYASICGFHKDLIGKLEFDMFLQQSDANPDWVHKMGISSQDVQIYAAKHCHKSNPFELKNKTILFTGAVAGFTGCEPYIAALRTLALEKKVDAIVTAGEWIKTIFLHKKASNPTILPALKKLAKDVTIYAIRSNRDHMEDISLLKDLGIKFINGIEDEKNVFTGLRLHRGSPRDQLTRYEDAHLGKNIFTFTTYVGLKTQALKGGGLRYLIGSGSSGYNTPSARFWATGYDSQLLNAGIRDSIGGHLLRFDNEGNVYPTTFRYHEDLKGILFGGRAYFPNNVRKGKLHLVISDFHASSHNKWALTALLEFIRKHKDEISTFAINGDFFDNMLLCHHNRGRFFTQIELAKRDLDFIKEVAYSKECLKTIISELNLNTKLIFKMGNHEVNSFRSFVNRDINHFLHKMLELDKLLGLRELGFEIVDSKESYDISEITIHHGHEMMRRTAAKIFGSNNARGHSHACEIGPDGITLPGMEDPDKADYLPHKYSKWSLGFSAITEYQERAVLPQPILMNNNRYSDFEEVKELDEEYQVPLPDKLTLTYDISWTGREEL